MNYPLLFSKTTINGLELKNRLVMTPMGCGLANEDGTVTDELIAYYEERAQGGAALLYTEVACVNDVHGRRSRRQIGLTDDSQIPGLKKLTDTIHKYDCRIFTQLLHPGVITSNAANGGRELPGPSGVTSRFLKQKARAFTAEELHDLVKDYADAAKRAKEGGFDGVEIHAAHHYLLHEFLSPYFNKREDEYGGSFENRIRLLLEITDAVRKSVGPDYPVTVRISAEDYMGNESYHLDEMLRLCRILESHGIDAISVTAGGTENGRSHSLEPVSYPEGWRRHLAGSIRKMVSVPVISTTVIRDPAYAESLLADGYMDLIGMGRSFLADPQWPKKAQEGRPEDIRRCISCMRCIDLIKSGQPIGCSVNAECGREYIIAQHRAAKTGAGGGIAQVGEGRLCVIAGAGVAGMECARILAMRGFKVVVFEKEDHIGGQVWLAGQAPHQEKMLWLVDHYEKQLAKLGVEIRLSHTLTAEEALKLHPAHIVDATGSSAYYPETVSGWDSPLVITPPEVLSGKSGLQNSNVVLLGTGLTALETAEYLAERGNMITIIGESETVSSRGGNSIVIADLLRRLDLFNAVVMNCRRITKIGHDRIFYVHTKTGMQFELPCDKVVLCKGVRSVGRVAAALKELQPGAEVHVIGDAAKPARIREDILDGYKMGWSLR